MSAAKQASSAACHGALAPRSIDANPAGQSDGGWRRATQRKAAGAPCRYVALARGRALYGLGKAFPARCCRRRPVVPVGPTAAGWWPGGARRMAAGALAWAGRGMGSARSGRRAVRARQRQIGHESCHD
jgi:hypothetical protein